MPEYERPANEKVLMESVRCFREQTVLPIRPLTLLVGENSTGKTTALALIRAARELVYRAATPDFNREPFELGAYDNIAAWHGGRGKRRPMFSVGWSGTIGGRTLATRSEFRSDSGHPQLQRWSFQQGEDLAITVSRNPRRDGEPLWEGKIGGVELDFRSGAAGVRASPGRSDLSYGPPLLEADLLLRSSTAPRSATSSRLLHAYRSLEAASLHRGVRSAAPVRSRPRRTYDPRLQQPDPEGAHVPMTLASFTLEADTEWAPLAEALKEVGRETGLFRSVAIKRLGSKAGGSEPFHLLIDVGARSFNIVDVGYGVSQALPVIVEALLAPQGTTFLLQQPEVHLHPRAQAGMGTFLARSCQARKHTYVVETHSDYLVDRVRLEVRRGTLAPGDVALLYFSRDKLLAKIEEVQLDERGRVIRSPEGYRGFFLELAFRRFS